MSVTTCTSFRLIEHLNRDELHLFVACNDYLGDAFAWVNDEVLVGNVDEKHLQFTTVVGVYGARSVENGDAMLECETASWTHLCLITYWQCDVKTCRNELTLKWMECDRLLNVGADVETRTLFGGISRQWLLAFVYYLYWKRHIFSIKGLNFRQAAAVDLLIEVECKDIGHARYEVEDSHDTRLKVGRVDVILAAHTCQQLL